MKGAVLVCAAGVGSIRLAGRLDPDIRRNLRKIRRGRQRWNAQSGAGLVTPLPAMVATVDSAGVDKCIDVGTGACCGGPVGAAPTIARGVGDEVGAAPRPSRRPEKILEFRHVAGFVHRRVKRVKSCGDDLGSIKRLAGVNEWLLCRSVIGSVIDKPIHRTQACRRS